MGDPLSVSASIVAVVTFGAQCAASLMRVIQDFQRYPSTVAQLLAELQTLKDILASLETALADGTYDFSGLKSPVRDCGEACKEFTAILLHCTDTSGEGKRSIKNWAKLKFRGEDINSFKNLLATYKGTIAVALCDANLRTSNITLAALKDYKDWIQTVTCDLEVRLESLDDKVQASLSLTEEISEHHIPPSRQIEDEKASLQQCLDICTQVSSHIDVFQQNLSANNSSASDEYPGYAKPSLSATAITLQSCNTQLQTTSAWLTSQLAAVEKLQHQLKVSSPQVNGNRKGNEDRLREDVKTVLKSLELLRKAEKQADERRQSVFEDISIAEDGLQAVVSTVGDLIHARRVQAGPRSMQLLGQLPAESFQQTVKIWQNGRSEK